MERARAYAKRLDAELAIIDKRREAANVAEVMNIIGDVEGSDCVIVDDMVDTAGTLYRGRASAASTRGRRSVSAVITHPVLSGPGHQAHLRIASHGADRHRHDSAAAPDAEDCEKLTVVSVAPLLGEAIRRINNEESVSSLFV